MENGYLKGTFAASFLPSFSTRTKDHLKNQKGQLPPKMKLLTSFLAFLSAVALADANIPCQKAGDCKPFTIIGLQTTASWPRECEVLIMSSQPQSAVPWTIAAKDWSVKTRVRCSGIPSATSVANGHAKLPIMA